MSFAPETDTETFAKPDALLRVPVGLASPLWGLFAGAAISGAAWWWMTRWARPQNLEAMFGASAEPTAPLVEAAQAGEAAAEPVLEALPQATPEPLEAVEPPVEAPRAAEAAPVSPAIEASVPEATAEPASEVTSASATKPKKTTAAKSA